MRVVAMVILHHLLSSLMLKEDISCESLTSLPKPFVYTKTGNLVRAVYVLCYSYWLTSLSFMCTAIGILLFCYLISDPAAYSLEITVSTHHFGMLCSSNFHVMLYLDTSISFFILFSVFHCTVQCQLRRMSRWIRHLLSLFPLLHFYSSALPSGLHSFMPHAHDIHRFPLYISSPLHPHFLPPHFSLSFWFPPDHHLIRYHSLHSFFPLSVSVLLPLQQEGFYLYSLVPSLQLTQYQPLPLPLSSFSPAKTEWVHCYGIPNQWKDDSVSCAARGRQRPGQIKNRKNKWSLRALDGIVWGLPISLAASQHNWEIPLFETISFSASMDVSVGCVHTFRLFYVDFTSSLNDLTWRLILVLTDRISVTHQENKDWGGLVDVSIHSLLY